MSLVEDALAGPSVFKDQSALSFDFVPPELPGREEAIKRLSQAFRVFYEGKGNQMATIRGPVGSGKTAMSRFFARDLREAMRKQNRSLKVAYVNCRNDRTDAMAMTSLLREMDKGFPDRGFSVPEMLEALRRRIEKTDTSVLVILDEVDVLLKEKGESDLLYSLSRFEVPNHPGALGVILVAQKDVVPMLDEATRSTVKGTNTIALEGYERDPMQRIVDQRVKLAFHPGMIPEDVGNLVADIGAEKGDARLAIEVLAAAGTNADDRGEELVTAEDVRVAKAAKMSEFPEQKLRELPLHELLVLLSVARRLAKSGDAYATTGPVESTYQVACESANEKPRGHTQFWTYMKNLASYGFLHLQISSAGHAGTTQLISLPDAPAFQVRDKIVQIVRDTHGKDV